MKRICKTLTLCSLAMLVFALSCGHPKTLESITVSPSSGGVTSTSPVPPAGSQTQFTALGNYINPTEQVDITNSVVWTSSSTQVAVVETSPDPKPGLVTSTGIECGGTLITATAGKNLVGPGSSNEVVVGTAQYVVTDNTACGGSGQEPALNVSVTGTGTVTSQPSGISCVAGTCTANFPLNSAVVLTAAPSGSATSVSWSGCTQSTTNSLSCTAAMNSSTVNVFATFL